jgi:SNF2 family DNA or RNA helicase
MTKEQAEAYKVIKKEKVLRHGEDETAVKNTLELMLRLHQVAGGWTVKPHQIEWVGADGDKRVKTVYDPVQLIEPAKNPKLIEVQSILEEIRHKKQGLIWAVYLPEVMALIDVAKKMGMKVGELHGGVKEGDRQPSVDAFKRGELDLIIGNASTGGMGYSMHTAEVNIFYNNTFKLRDRLQAEDRSWGDGQTKPGIWIDLIADKTVDRTVYHALKQKEDVHNYVRHRIKHMTALLDGE